MNKKINLNTKRLIVVSISILLITHLVFYLISFNVPSLQLERETKKLEKQIREDVKIGMTLEELEDYLKGLEEEDVSYLNVGFDDFEKVIVSKPLLYYKIFLVKLNDGSYERIIEGYNENLQDKNNIIGYYNLGNFNLQIYFRSNKVLEVSDKYYNSPLLLDFSKTFANSIFD